MNAAGSRYVRLSIDGRPFTILGGDGVAGRRPRHGQGTPGTVCDTINVPAKGRARIAWLPDDRPGSWMYRCHILEHHAAGMMAHFEVLS